MNAEQAADRVDVGFASPDGDRRKNDRVDPVSQNRFRAAMLRLVLAALVPAAMMALAVIHLVDRKDALLGTLWVPIGLTLAAIAGAFYIVRLCDKTSNRYVGPTRRIVRTLEAIRRGERPAPIQVRRSDEFETLVNCLNETLQQLGAMDEPPR